MKHSLKLAAIYRTLRYEGAWAYDCEEKDEVLFIPWVYAFQGDNPMQSEIASHIGLTGNAFCRLCYVHSREFGGYEADMKGKGKERDKPTKSELMMEFVKVRSLLSLLATLHC